MSQRLVSRNAVIGAVLSTILLAVGCTPLPETTTVFDASPTPPAVPTSPEVTQPTPEIIIVVEDTATPESTLSPTPTTPPTLDETVGPLITWTPGPSPTPDTTTPSSSSSSSPSVFQPTPAPTIPVDPNNALPGGQINYAPVASGFDQPTNLLFEPSGRLVVLERAGRAFTVAGAGQPPELLIDIRDRVYTNHLEQGLLGMAFDPNYAANHIIYVAYTPQPDGNTQKVRLSQFEVVNGLAINEAPLLTTEKFFEGHNGGHLLFGADGYLYMSIGDGGSNVDILNTAQEGDKLLGVILRIDVQQGFPYAIPPDNPFVNEPTIRDEIWAFGLRNPWRFAFDPLNRDMFIADVGHSTFEEIDFIPGSHIGAHNFGWPIMEGPTCQPEGTTCEQAGLSPPVFSYRHDRGCSITGGYVYRGASIPALSGKYLFGDYCLGTIWTLDRNTWNATALSQPPFSISTFGQDSSGEIYVADYFEGMVYKIVAVP